MGENTEPDPQDRRTTTIQISNEIWAALDRRKNRGDTFDDVIRRLIDATGIGVGELKGPHPDIDVTELKPIPDGEQPEKGCSFDDVISGKKCDQKPVVRQEWNFANSDADPRTFYYCEEHAPDA